jgi:hypothetical protein
MSKEMVFVEINISIGIDENTTREQAVQMVKEIATRGDIEDHNMTFINENSKELFV